MLLVVLSGLVGDPGIILVIFLYKAYQAVSIGLRGQTLGKWFMRLRVVNNDGKNPGLLRAVLREVVGKLISMVVLILTIALFPVLLVMYLVVTLPAAMFSRYAMRIPTVVVAGGAAWGAWKLGSWMGRHFIARMMPWMGHLPPKGRTLYDRIAGTREIQEFGSDVNADRELTRYRRW